MAFLRVKLVQRGKSFKDFQIKIAKKVQLTEQSMATLGALSLAQMHFYISGSILRQPSSGALINSIKMYFITQGVGIGRIPDLVPYWGVMNFGATVDGKAFVPGGGKLVTGDFGGERPDNQYQGVPGGGGIRMNPQGAYAVRATLTVTPKNYIEKTINWLRSNWINHLKSSGL